MVEATGDQNVHHVPVYAILFDGFLAPKYADYPMVDHIEYRLRRAWPRGIVRRYVGEAKSQIISDLALEDLLHFVESGPTVIHQIHVYGYSVGTANAIRFCDCLGMIPFEPPEEPREYQLHPGLFPAIKRTHVIDSKAWRRHPLTSLVIMDCNARTHPGMDLGFDETPVVNIPIQSVLHLRSVKGPMRGLLDGRGLPVEFPEARSVKELFFRAHHGKFRLEGGRPALSMDDEAPSGDTEEEANSATARKARPSEEVVAFMLDAARQPHRPVLIAGGVPESAEA